MNFKKDHNFIDRQKEAHRILQKYPDRIPVICERDNTKYDIPELVKKKFLLPKDLKMVEFIFIVRNKMKINNNIALFFTINGTVPNSTQTMHNLYEEYKERDGFLYIVYTPENTFGN